MDLNGIYDSSRVLNTYVDSVLEGLENTRSRNAIPVVLNASRLTVAIEVLKSNAVELDYLSSTYFTRILNGIDAVICNRSDRDSALNNAFSAASALSEFFAGKQVQEANGLKSAALYLNSAVGELKSFRGSE